MADLSTEQAQLGSVYPVSAAEAGWDATGPLIAPDKVKRVHLFGIPLVSAIRDPFTGRPDVMDEARIQEFIIEAVALVNTETGLDLFPTQYEERHAYDQAEQQSFGTMQVRRRPVSAVQQLAIQSNDGVNIFTVPVSWLDPGYLYRGQLNILPFAVSAQSGTTVPLASPIGVGLLPALFRFHWVPGFWTVTYTAGFKDGMMPAPVNHLIGVVAAMEILSALGATYSRSTSASLGIDGLSQSTTTPGPDLFRARIEALASKRKWLVKRLRSYYGLHFPVTNV